MPVAGRRETADDFPARLALARRFRGLTQREFADRLGVRESTVSGGSEHSHYMRADPGADALKQADGMSP